MEWNEVKAKPKKKVVKNTEDDVKPVYGGKKAGGKLVAGPVQTFGGSNVRTNNDYSTTQNNASAITDYEYYQEEIAGYEEVKFETVSHQCSQAISQAR